MPESRTALEPILVVSPSECLRRRIGKVLSSDGFAVDQARGARELAQHRRQRPFLLCFLDARSGGVDLGSCLGARPAERYVLIVEPWERIAERSVPEGANVFGYLREPFGAHEVCAWAERATDEAQLLQGDRSLEDLLYGRFRLFLQNLGPQAMTSLHELVWERVERPLIQAVLEWTGGNQSRAASILGIHRNTLRAKIRSLGIDLSQRSGERT